MRNILESGGLEHQRARLWTKEYPLQSPMLAPRPPTESSGNKPFRLLEALRRIQKIIGIETVGMHVIISFRESFCQDGAERLTIAPDRCDN
ncbi:MAG TPA: hypothetical protein VFR21_09430 [Bradyrhizobium sp.]|nr:hypothetical protein [Bradyrhizobium sp.]